MSSSGFRRQQEGKTSISQSLFPSLSAEGVKSILSKYDIIIDEQELLKRNQTKQQILSQSYIDMSLLTKDIQFLHIDTNLVDMDQHEKNAFYQKNKIAYLILHAILEECKKLGLIIFLQNIKHQQAMAELHEYITRIAIEHYRRLITEYDTLKLMEKLNAQMLDDLKNQQLQDKFFISNIENSIQVIETDISGLEDNRTELIEQYADILVDNMKGFTVDGVPLCENASDKEILGFLKEFIRATHKSDRILLEMQKEVDTLEEKINICENQINKREIAIKKEIAAKNAAPYYNSVNSFSTNLRHLFIPQKDFEYQFQKAWKKDPEARRLEGQLLKHHDDVRIRTERMDAAREKRSHAFEKSAQRHLKNINLEELLEKHPHIQNDFETYLVPLKEAHQKLHNVNDEIYALKNQKIQHIDSKQKAIVEIEKRDINIKKNTNIQPPDLPPTWKIKKAGVDNA